MAAGSTYTPIATTTLGSATASYTFTSISASYTDVVLVATLEANGTNFDIQVGNGSADTGTNYSSTRIYGNGTSALSDRQTNNSTGVTGNNASSSAVPVNFIAHFQNYANTTTNKTVLTRFNRSDGLAMAVVGLWRSTSAINTIKIYSTNSSTLAIGSTFTLYGIAAA